MLKYQWSWFQYDLRISNPLGKNTIVDRGFFDDCCYSQQHNISPSSLVVVGCDRRTARCAVTVSDTNMAGAKAR